MKIAVLYPDDFSIWQFKRAMIQALVTKGHEVYIICPSGDYIHRLESLGIIHISVNFYRFLNPWKDLKYFIQLYRIFRKYNFDVVHNLTIKPNIYGAIVAKLAGIRRILGTAEGLGSVYLENPEFKIKLLKPFISRLYWLGCHLSDRFWFLNEDDLFFFVSQKIIDRKKTVLIKSTGVNIEEYSPHAINHHHLMELKEEFKIDNKTKVVLMVVARFLWSKGVREVIEAYEILKYKCPNIIFILVGAFEKGNSESVPKNYLSEKASNSFKVLNFRNDIKELIFLSDLVILPSYYREGVPRILLEAMSMGKPIVTTDNVGCREVVEQGKNGFLVPVKNSEALANSIKILIDDDNKRIEFGKYGRLKVEREFSDGIIVNKILKELYQMNC